MPVYEVDEERRASGEDVELVNRPLTTQVVRHNVRLEEDNLQAQLDFVYAAEDDLAYDEAMEERLALITFDRVMLDTTNLSPAGTFIDPRPIDPARLIPEEMLPDHIFDDMPTDPDSVRAGRQLIDAIDEDGNDYQRFRLRCLPMFDMIVGLDLHAILEVPQADAEPIMRAEDDMFEWLFSDHIRLPGGEDNEDNWRRWRETVKAISGRPRPPFWCWRGDLPPRAEQEEHEFLELRAPLTTLPNTPDSSWSKIGHLLPIPLGYTPVTYLPRIKAMVTRPDGVRVADWVHHRPSLERGVNLRQAIHDNHVAHAREGRPPPRVHNLALFEYFDDEQIARITDKWVQFKAWGALVVDVRKLYADVELLDYVRNRRPGPR